MIDGTFAEDEGGMRICRSRTALMSIPRPRPWTPWRSYEYMASMTVFYAIYPWVSSVLWVSSDVPVVFGELWDLEEVEWCESGLECGWGIRLCFDSEGGDCPDLAGCWLGYICWGWRSATWLADIPGGFEGAFLLVSVWLSWITWLPVSDWLPLSSWYPWVLGYLWVVGYLWEVGNGKGNVWKGVSERCLYSRGGVGGITCHMGLGRTEFIFTKVSACSSMCKGVRGGRRVGFC